MLHGISAISFILAIIIYLVTYIKGLKKKNKILMKWHASFGVISCSSMILYSVLDYFNEKESYILLFIPTMILILITGSKYFRKKYKFSHLISVGLFLCVLTTHIIL